MEKGGRKKYITQRNGRSSWELQGIVTFCACQWNEWNWKTKNSALHEGEHSLTSICYFEALLQFIPFLCEFDTVIIHKWCGSLCFMFVPSRWWNSICTIILVLFLLIKGYVICRSVTTAVTSLVLFYFITVSVWRINC